MGLRDLFRRTPREVDWTAELRDAGRSRPAGSGSPRPNASGASDEVPTHHAAPSSDGLVSSSMNVTTTTIGPDGRETVITGHEALAQIPPEARRQLEALGLDRFITGEATQGGAPSMGFGDVVRMMRAMPGMAGAPPVVQASLEAALADATGAVPGSAGEGGADEDPVARLRALGDLRDRGVITEEEFATLKRKLIDATGDDQDLP